ncbi:cytochrome c1 [Methylocapsa acidiphila]|uniref:cytochrome c1 n=1 Tax=Methylocapsa acidiphila TaxID=133552 RepID=UPI000420E9DA|nr:cytochrome c1 [Methylocapsa acidiphila]
MSHCSLFGRALGLAILLASAASTGSAFAAGASETPSGAQGPHALAIDIPARQVWSFAGPFGKYDPAQLQRGLKVYREVCSNCHSLKMVAFRDLMSPDGPNLTEAEARAIAEAYKIKDGPNDAGEMFERPGRLSDYFPWAFPNEQTARAAFGAVPPDMSLLAKARTYERGFPLFLLDPFIQYQERGVDYIYALLTGYTNDKDPNWDEYFPGHKIAMPNPLSDGAVDYADGAPKTVQQYAKDISAFLMWAAEPKLVERKRIGFRVLVYLAVFAALLYLVKRKIWARLHNGASEAHRAQPPA